MKFTDSAITNLDFEPELRLGPPRQVRDTAATCVLRRVLWNGLLAAFCLAYFLASQNLTWWRQLEDQGKVAVANVIGKHLTSGKSITYYRDFEFSVDQQSVTGSEEVPSSTYAQTSLGDPLDVTYLPLDPEQYVTGAVTATRIDERRDNFTTGIGIGTAVLILCLVLMERNFARSRRLLREGTAARAVVTGRREVRGKSAAYYLTYELNPPVPGILPRTVSVSRDKYEQNNEGDSFTALYVLGQSTDVAPYFQLGSAEIVA